MDRGLVRGSAVLLFVSGAALILVGCADLTNLDLREGLVQHVQKPLPGAEQPYPNLASVPENPPQPTPKEKRRDLVKKLEADSKSAVYQPDVSQAPQLPPEPAALPPGFLTAEAPVKLPQAPPEASATQRTSRAAPNGQATQATNLPAGAPDLETDGRTGRVAIILFEAGSSQIDPGQVAELKPLVATLHERGGVLRVVGYAEHASGTSGTRDKIADFNLSLDRANAVGRALIGLGVKPSELVLRAEGDSAPLLSIAGVEGRAAGQRADIYYER